MTRYLLAAILLAMAALPSAPASAADTTTVGAKKALGNGHAWTWVKRGDDGMVTAFGLSFDDAALAGLPAKDAEIPLAMPAAEFFPFRTAVIDWNAHGHPPAHVYGVPHFDFHFYTISEEARMAIKPVGPAAKAVPAAPDLPAGFMTDGATIPMMGKHYIDAKSPEFHGTPFTATPIYGYYGGRNIFIEQMVTRAYLLAATRPRNASLPQPARYAQDGVYPTHWSIVHDAAAHRYDIVFDALRMQVASR